MNQAACEHTNKGLYIHVPFCVSKCPYCDFYSMASDEETKDAYAHEVVRNIQTKTDCFDTAYFGGGTPSLLGARRISQILNPIAVTKEAEITLEANPGDDLTDVFRSFASCGGNRVSIGLQTADDELLKKLGRRHTLLQVEKAVDDARENGIHRISLDLMLGIPGQTMENIQRGVEFCSRMGVEHVSSYMLKLESGTPFGLHPPDVPDEDETAELYLYACEELEKEGYKQYEISNFARDGAVSRHNLKYWNCDEVAAIGPAAHGFENGIRYAYARDLKAFLNGTLSAETEIDEEIPTGSQEEYAILQLRLTDGLRFEQFKKRFQRDVPENWIQNAKALSNMYVEVDETSIRMTREGFLVSNAILSKLF